MVILRTAVAERAHVGPQATVNIIALFRCDVTALKGALTTRRTSTLACRNRASIIALAMAGKTRTKTARARASSSRPGERRPAAGFARATEGPEAGTEASASEPRLGSPTVAEPGARAGGWRRP